MGIILLSFIKALLIALYTLTLTHLTAAQTFIPSAASNSFPACGLNCTVLLEAQSVCVPPAAPVADQAVYVACFCQTAFLAPLYSSPDATCDETCTLASDRIEVSAWYIEFCAAANGTTSSKKTTTTSSASKTSMTAARTSSTTGTKTTSSAASSSSDAATTAVGLSTGAKAGIGVGVALGVLAVVLAVIGFLMVKRHHRKGRISGKRKPSQKRFDKSELDTSTEIPRTRSRAELQGDEPPQLAEMPREPLGPSQLPMVSNEKERVYEI